MPASSSALTVFSAAGRASSIRRSTKSSPTATFLPYTPVAHCCITDRTTAFAGAGSRTNRRCRRVLIDLLQEPSPRRIEHGKRAADRLPRPIIQHGAIGVHRRPSPCCICGKILPSRCRGQMVTDMLTRPRCTRSQPARRGRGDEMPTQRASHALGRSSSARPSQRRNQAIGKRAEALHSGTSAPGCSSCAATAPTCDLGSVPQAGGEIAAGSVTQGTGHFRDVPVSIELRSGSAARPSTDQVWGLRDDVPGLCCSRNASAESRTTSEICSS